MEGEGGFGGLCGLVGGSELRRTSRRNIATRGKHLFPRLSGASCRRVVQAVERDVGRVRNRRQTLHHCGFEVHCERIANVLQMASGSRAPRLDCSMR